MLTQPQINQRLPVFCVIAHPVDGSSIMVRRGEVGFWIVSDVPDPAEWQRVRGIGPDEARAMEIGAMFGWHVPGADPDHQYHKPA